MTSHRIAGPPALLLRTAELSSALAASPRFLYAGIALLAAGGAAVLYLFDPRETAFYPLCPFLGLTGYHCPGCGTLRALHELLHGNPISALGYNPFTVLSLPFIAYSLFAGGMRAYRLPAPRAVFLHPLWIWSLLAGIIAFWALRNAPVWPLSALAP